MIRTALSVARTAFVSSVLVLLALPTWSDGHASTSSGNTSGTDPSGDTASSSPGDDIGTLPARAEVSGITLLGSLAELRSLGLVLRGQGRVEIVPLTRLGYAVTFFGTYRIELDRAALARTNVAVLFRSGATFTDGRAQLAIGGSVSAFATPRRVPLPLRRLAEAPEVQGDFLSLHILGPLGNQAHVVAAFDRERVALFQRLR